MSFYGRITQEGKTAATTRRYFELQEEIGWRYQGGDSSDRHVDGSLVFAVTADRLSVFGDYKEGDPSRR